MRFRSDAQRKAVFWRLGSKFSFGTPSLTESGFMFGDTDYEEYSKKPEFCHELAGGRFSIEPGDRVLKLGNENIDYGLHAGVVKEVKDRRALIRFDDTGNEIWYPEDMVYTQRMLDEDLKK